MPRKARVGIFQIHSPFSRFVCVIHIIIWVSRCIGGEIRNDFGL